MTDKEYQKERRRQGRLERLGINNPKCLFCEEDDPSCLELHHLSGKGFGDDCAIVCRNCHRKLTDKQKDHPPPVNVYAPTEKPGRLLLGIADALEMLKVPGQLISLIRQSGLGLIESGWLYPAPGGGDEQCPFLGQ
jgi:hypothetical protein